MKMIRQIKQLKARAPAKLILSGEHAVLYGSSAIAMAVDCYAESTIRSHFSPKIFFNFLNLQYAKSFTLSTLYVLRQEIQEHYYAFLEGRGNIREVLKKPFELLQFTVTNLLEKFHISPIQGVEIHTHSDIPIGCGMGSSAATVMSTLFALAKFFRLDIDPIRFLNLGLDAENLQHGKSSGLDLHLAMQGGCLKFESGQVIKRPLPKLPFIIVNTGVPTTSTGQCVVHVAPHFKNSNIVEDFRAVTQSLDQALDLDNGEQIQQCIKENHRLLVNIGVVPNKVQAFIQAIEKEGASAKICGAGAVEGDNGGIVLIFLNAQCDQYEQSKMKVLENIVHHFGFIQQKVQGDLRGTHLVV